MSSPAETASVGRPLAGRRAVVSGAAGGIGAAAVASFLAAGADVVGLYHTTPPPDDLTGRCEWVACDARDRRSFDAAFEQATSVLGGLDVLLHAAGSWRPSTPESLSDDELDLVLDANLRTTVLTNQAAFERMRRSGGQTINLGSAEGVRGNSLAPHYAMAKAGVHAWTRSAAAAWGRSGVTVNALAPAVSTPGAERLWGHLGQERAAVFKERSRTTMPLRGELGDPDTDLGPSWCSWPVPGAVHHRSADRRRRWTADARRLTSRVAARRPATPGRSPNFSPGDHPAGRRPR